MRGPYFNYVLEHEKIRGKSAKEALKKHSEGIQTEPHALRPSEPPLCCLLAQEPLASLS